MKMQSLCTSHSASVILMIALIFNGFTIPLWGQEFKEDKSTGKWMLINEKGKPDKSILYDTVKPFTYGWAPVRYQGKWGCVNHNNKWGVEPLYEELDILKSEVVRIKSGMMYGIANLKGEILLPAAYEAIDHYRTGYGTVKQKGEWQTLTPEGMSRENLIFESPDQKACIEDCDPCDQKCSSEKMAQVLFPNIRYPARARENGIQGRVILSAIIDENGRMTQHTLERGIYPPCDEEAMRVFLMMNFNWVPARHEGQVVKSRIYFPVQFILG